MKRFWEQARMTGLEDCFGIELDGKPLRVPDGGVLRLPTAPLAQAIAAEWQEAGGTKGGEMSYADVPFTRLAGTAQERIAPNPEPVIEELARYAESDLLCYRATHPQPLVLRQACLWQPWLDWAASHLQAPLLVTEGIGHVTQPSASLARLAAAVARQDVHGLAALGILVPVYGSLVLALAVAEGALEAEAGYELSTLDERFQIDQWGWDREAEDRIRKQAAEVAMAGRYLALCTG